MIRRMVFGFTAALALAGGLPPEARAQQIGLAAREALAEMLGEGSLVVYGTVVDTVHNYDNFLPFGEFAGILHPPKGSMIRYVHARIEVHRVLRGRASGRELTFGVPVEFIRGPDTLGAASDTARTAPAREIGPGFAGVFPLLMEPRAPGGYLLGSLKDVIPEEDGKIRGEEIPRLAMAARAFYGMRDIEVLTVNADAIVLAQVSRIRKACETRRDTVFTCVDLNISQTFKTDIDSMLTVLVPDAAATSWRVPIVRNDIPGLEVGDERYFFLVNDPEGRWRLLEGRSGVVHSVHGWIVEWPRDGGPVIGLNMDPDGFAAWVARTLERAMRGEL